MRSSHQVVHQIRNSCSPLPLKGSRRYSRMCSQTSVSVQDKLSSAEKIRITVKGSQNRMTLSKRTYLKKEEEKDHWPGILTWSSRFLALAEGRGVTKLHRTLILHLVRLQSLRLEGSLTPHSPSPWASGIAGLALAGEALGPASGS